MAGRKGASQQQQQPQQQQPLLLDESIAKLFEDLREEFSAKFKRLELLLESSKQEAAASRTEVKKLQAALDEKDKEIHNIKRRANDQEQYIRSWSIRILNMDLPPGSDSSDPIFVMKQVFERLLKPIFEAAIADGLWQSMPAFSEVLETAHILPTKPGQTPPIIARFYSRNIKALIFRLKKAHAPKQTAQQDQQAGQTRSKSRQQPAKLAYPFFEDLTTANFRKMRALAADSRVLACWSVAGQLRFRLNGEEEIRKVDDIFSTIDDIIKKTTRTKQPTAQTSQT